MRKLLGPRSSTRAGGGKSVRHLHLLASLAGVAVGAALTVTLVSSGETAQDPRVIHAHGAAAGMDTSAAAGQAPSSTVTPPVLATVRGGLDAGLGKPPTSAKREIIIPAPDETPDLKVTIGRGDTLTEVLVEAGVERALAHNAATALAKIQDPRRIRPGQEMTLQYAPANGDAEKRLASVIFHASVESDVVAERTGDTDFTASLIERPLETRVHVARANIEDSLFVAADRAGVPMPVILELIQIYSFDVDFQRDIQPSDSFEVMFQSSYTPDGKVARHGDVIYASLNVGDRRLPLYRFEMSDGEVDYFDARGRSVRKALMKTPIDGARLSSRFGPRRHPILGYTKMHRGVDFAAPKGTPIMAAGKGKVEFAGRNGSYGKYIRVRHNSEFKTAYAHLSRVAKGIRKGARVRQGQIIGYVGSTGRSTGPHLHYEIIRNGKQVNPLALKLPSGRTLKGKELAAFKQQRLATDNQLAQAKPVVNVASAK